MFNKINVLPYFRTVLLTKSIVLKKFEITESELLILIEINYRYRISHRSMIALNRSVSAGQFIEKRNGLINKGLIEGIECISHKPKKRGFVYMDLMLTQKGKNLLQDINQILADKHNSLIFDKTTINS